MNSHCDASGAPGSSSRPGRVAPTSGRLLRRLNSALSSKQFYEAHQLLKTLNFRLISAGQFQQLANLLEHGAKSLLVENQWESGADLACMLVDAMSEGGLSVDMRMTNTLGELHSLMRVDSPERTSFISKCLALLQKQESPQLAATFNRDVGRTLWSQCNYSEARRHLVRCADGVNCALLLIDLHLAKGYASEVELFLAQTVLQLLCQRQHKPAALCFRVYTSRHPGLQQVPSGPPFERLPLLNFIWLLLLAVERGCSVAVYTVLCEQYQAALSRDPSYLQYLDKIGQLFFGLPAPVKEPSNNLLSSIMNSVFGSGLEDDFEEAAAATDVERTVVAVESEDVD